MKSQPFTLSSCLRLKRVLPACLALTTSSVLAVTAPYSETFDDGVADGFSHSGVTGTYALHEETAGYSYQASLSAEEASVHKTASAALEITNFTAASARIVSTDFKIDSFSVTGGGTVNAGLILISNSSDFSAGTQYRLQYEIADGTPGKLKLMRNGHAIATSSGSMAPRIDVAYTLMAVVTFNEGSIIIHGALYDDTNTLVLSAVDNAPLQGAYFGYRTALLTGTAAAHLAVRYDNFGVSHDSTAQTGDSLVGGSLSVSGALDVLGNVFTLGESGSTYAAGFIYDTATADFSSHLTAPDGAWSWRRGSTLGMSLDAQNRLRLIDDSGVASGVFLDPCGVSEFKALHVKEDLSVGGGLRIAPQGDLSMGTFTTGTNPAQ